MHAINDKRAAIEGVIAAFCEELDARMGGDNPPRADRALLKIIAPYLWTALEEKYCLPLYGDARLRTYEVCCVFSTVSDSGIDVRGCTDGAVVSDSGEIESPAFEPAGGLRGVADMLAEYVGELGAPFTLKDLRRRLNNLRPTISRRGAATMRAECDGWNLTAIVRRG